jgi:protoporphyrinogen oxidase
VDLKIIPWRQSLVQARPGHAANIANIAALAQALPAFALVGAAIGGNGITGNIRKCYEAIAQLKERQGQ